MNKPRDIEFGKRMKSARESRGLTQKQLAQEFGLSERAVQFYEQGRSKPPAAKLAEIASFLGVTADELLRGNRGTTSQKFEKHGTVPRREIDEPEIPPEELAFLTWVKEHVTGMHFYDMKKSRENDEWLRGLRIIYEKEKGRKPGQKQGE